MRIRKEEFLNNPFYGKKIHADKEYVYYSDFKLNTFLKENLLKYLGLIMGIVLAITILFLNSKRIKEIVFNAEYVINKEIEKDIYNCTNTYLSWTFLNKSIIDINHEIRGKYPMYEWIGIAKVNNIVYVNITNNKTKEQEITALDKCIIAKKDGMVKKVVVYDGTNKTQYNKYVRKGDILISNEIEPTRGYILAETCENKVIKVRKKEIKKQLTGKMNKYYELNLFGLCLNFNKKNDYSDFEIRKSDTFNIGILSFSNVYIYEKSDIMDMYGIDEGKKLVSEYLDACFMKTLDEEKIIEINYLTIEETKDYLSFNVLVKKIENIGVYQ